MPGHFRKLDWILIASVIILCAISLLVLFSFNFQTGPDEFNSFKRQTYFFIFGFFAMIIMSFLDFRIFKNYSLILVALYLLLLAALVALFFFGLRVHGTQGWFDLGIVNFEPVELAKLVILLILAKYFSNRHIEVYRARHIIASGIYVLIPLALVLIQPDLGSAMILGAIWLGMVILSEIKFKHLALVALGAVSVFILAWFFVLQPYQKDRVLNVINSEKDPLGSSYNLIQSKIAVGSGGLWGKGLGQGSQGQLNFLPEKHTDFIFPVFAEEWGSAGVIFLFCVYGVFFWRLVRISLNATNNFSRLFASGFAVMVFAQVFINIGMTIGIMPITGIPLSFMSYGGSNLLINFLALGIVQNMVVQSKSGGYLEREE